MVSAIFSLMHSKDGEAELKRNNAQRVRFYQATSPGFLLPEDWDALTADEQAARLDRVDKTALA